MARGAVRLLSSGALPAWGPRLALLGAVLGSACHEVVALDDPPLAQSQSVLLAFEDSDGELRYQSSTVPVQPGTSFVFSAGARGWAFGFGCALERLGIAGTGRAYAPDELASIPEDLPPPLESFVWTESGWSPTSLDALPGPLRERFTTQPIEACWSFAPRPEPLEGLRVSYPEPTVSPLEQSSEYLQLVAFGEDQLALLVPLLLFEEPRLARRSRTLFLAGSLTSGLQPVSLPSGFGDPLAIAARDGASRQLVVTSSTGIWTGSPLTGFERAIGREEGAEWLDPSFASVQMDVSPMDEPLEAYVIARTSFGAEPADYVHMYRAYEGRLTESRVDDTAEPATGGFGGPVPQIIRTRAGRAWASGFPSVGLVSLEGGLARYDREITSTALSGLVRGPGAGTFASDNERKMYFLAEGSDSWRTLGPGAEGQRPLWAGVLAGIPVALVQDYQQTDVRASIDGGPGVRFNYVRDLSDGSLAWRACAGPGVGWPAALVDVAQDIGRRWVGSTRTNDGWIFAVSLPVIIGSAPKVVFYRLRLEAEVGDCSTPG